MDAVSSRSKFSGIMAALFAFFIFAGTAAYIGVYAYLPDYIGISLVQYSTSGSVQSIVTAIMSFFAARALKKLGPRALMFFGSFMLIIYSLLIALFPGVPTLYFMSIGGGLVNSLAGFGCITDYMVKTFGAKSTSWISFAIGAATVGMGVGQGVAGVVMAQFGMQSMFLFVLMGCGILALVSTLLVKTPQKDFAADSTQEAAGNTAAAGANAKRESIFKNPAAWLIFLAMFCLAIPASIVLMYATAYFPSFGAITISEASVMVSIMGIATGFYNMISGKLMAKMGQKPYTIMIVLSVAAVNIFALLYSSVPTMLVLVMVVVAYVFSGTAMHLPSILAPSMFGLDRSTEVVTTGMGFVYGGNIVAPVLLAMLITNFGYTVAYITAICVSVVILICYIAMFAMTKKQSAISPKSDVPLKSE